MMKVTPVLGEPLRFHVQSESNTRKFYLVELDANRNAGQCNCAQWLMRIGPLITDDYQNKIKRRCKHLQAAFIFFAESILERISREQAERRARERQERANREAATIQ